MVVFTKCFLGRKLFLLLGVLFRILICFFNVNLKKNKTKHNSKHSPVVMRVLQILLNHFYSIFINNASLVGLELHFVNKISILPLSVFQQILVFISYEF